jgi:hypothetical protein
MDAAYRDGIERKLVTWAIESGDVRFCRNVYSLLLHSSPTKPLGLIDEYSPIELAAQVGSVEVFRWVIESGVDKHGGFDPHSIVNIAVGNNRLAFLRWFHEGYGSDRACTIILNTIGSYHDGKAECLDVIGYYSMLEEGAGETALSSIIEQARVGSNEPVVQLCRKLGTRLFGWEE